MNSLDESKPPGARRDSANGADAGKVPDSGPRLLHRQRKIAANWQEVEEFLSRLPVALAPFPYSVCLVSDRVMRRYNKQFRRKNETTDVLSFPMDPQESGEDYFGDILISVETAQRHAARFGLRLEDEIKVLILHGLLHLAGQDHERDKGQMARNERRWAARLGLARSLLAREPGTMGAGNLPPQRASLRPSRRRAV